MFINWVILKSAIRSGDMELTGEKGYTEKKKSNFKALSYFRDMLTNGDACPIWKEDYVFERHFFLPRPLVVRCNYSISRNPNVMKTPGCILWCHLVRCGLMCTPKLILCCFVPPQHDSSIALRYENLSDFKRSAISLQYRSISK